MLTHMSKAFPLILSEVLGKNVHPNQPTQEKSSDPCLQKRKMMYAFFKWTANGIN